MFSRKPKGISEKRMSEFKARQAEYEQLRFEVSSLTSANPQITNKEIGTTLDIPESMVRTMRAETQALAFVNETTPLERELSALLNKHSAENESNTPDFILARYLMTCLNAFNTANNDLKEFGRRDMETVPDEG